MSGFESLYDFKEQFEFAYENHQEIGNMKKDDADIALDLLYGLHSDKYSAFTAPTFSTMAKGYQRGIHFSKHQGGGEPRRQAQPRSDFLHNISPLDASGISVQATDRQVKRQQ